MKILQINAVSGIRSTGRTCVEIADYLNKNGDEGYIAYSDGLPYAKGYKIGTPFEIKLHGLFSRIFGMQAYFSRKGTRKLLNYMDELKPDVVHLHNLHANYINLKLLLTYLAENNISTVLTLNDCWFYTGKCTHYTANGCYKWKTGCGNCPRLKKDNTSWFFDCTRKMYHDKKKWFGKIPRLAVVGVSDWITNEARMSFLSSAKILIRIYNWIDIEVFKPVNTDELRKKLGLENKFIVLAVASGWSNNKGLDKIIDLAGKIPKDMKIILVGNMRKSVNLPGNIIHIKETHNVNKLVEYYSMVDVFINLSLEETFGKVTAEALACGTPAIVIKSTANPELVGEKCGYVLEEINITDLLEILLKVRENKKEYYSEYCKEFAYRNFNIHYRLTEYTDIYKELIGN